MSGLKTSSLGLNTLGTTECPASSHYVLVISLSWKIVMGPRFRVSSERLEKPGIEPMNLNLNLNSLLVKRQIDNPSPGAVTGGN